MSTQSDDSTIELIKRLSLAIGVTGYVGPNSIHQTAADEMQPYVDRVEQDRMGSLVALKHGEQSPAEERQRRKVMLAAHLDEIGAIVTKLDKGFLRFTKVGGLDDRVLMGQEVTVHAREELPGIIGSIPPHFLPLHESNDKMDLHKMHIDVGLPPADVEKLVQVGDLISFKAAPVELQNGLLAGKAMDNRASVAAMIVALRELERLRHQWDVYAVATADEEWGQFVGATTQAYAIRPDVAIVLDMTFADLDEVDVELNKGPVIALGPSNHPVVRERLVKICQDREIKFQNEVLSSGAGTDAYAVEISREGVPTVLVSTPSRYMHSPVEVVQPKDVERTGRLIGQFIAGLDEKFVDELIPKSQ